MEFKDQKDRITELEDAIAWYFETEAVQYWIWGYIDSRESADFEIMDIHQRAEQDLKDVLNRR